MIKSVAAFVILLLAAAACAGDDIPEQSRTTVPVVTAAQTTDDSDDVEDQPDETSDGATDDEPAETGEPADPDDPDDPDSSNADDADEAAPETPSPERTFGDLAAASIETEVIGNYRRPIGAVVAPNGEWWVALRDGEIVVVDHLSGEQGATIVDISGETDPRGEAGLLGLAVDGEALYINYTDLFGNTQVDAFVLDDDGRPAARHNLLSVGQPRDNHNGGSVTVGPDGYLYIGMGDGGGAGDPDGNGQNPNSHLASILRIDPTPGGDAPYAIPADNPFAAGGGAPEVFILGVRNPWRMSFDSQTGDLWIADVGQRTWEEVNLLLVENGNGRGQNLGWNLREGTNHFRGDRPTNNVDPVFEYHQEGNPGGCSVTGGYVYRGEAIPDLDGAYLFGDWCTSRIWAISIANDEVTFRDLNRVVPGEKLVSFGVDPDGEIVTISLDGPISRIIPG